MSSEVGAGPSDVAPAAPSPAAPALREARVINSRMRVASRIVVAVAGLCILGLVGGVAMGSDPTDETIFDLARKESSFEIEAARPGPGYLVGPILVLVLIVPLMWRKAEGGGRVESRFLYKSEYPARLGIAIGLWAAGLVVAIIVAATLSADDYTIESGTYIALTLLVVGLAASVAMWPFGTRTVLVDGQGNITEEAGAERQVAGPAADEGRMH